MTIPCVLQESIVQLGHLFAYLGLVHAGAITSFLFYLLYSLLKCALFWLKYRYAHLI